jgi:transcriptional regulator with XRE-family HTH domain
LSILKDFGLAFRKLREILGLSRQELEDRAEVEPETVAGFEEGELDVPLSTVDRLLAGLGLDIEDLLEAVLEVREGREPAKGAERALAQLCIQMLREPMSAEDLEHLQRVAAGARELMHWARQVHRDVYAPRASKAEPPLDDGEPGPEGGPEN